jgi:5-(carboxyamino)imidazole ribonucleotide mutase
MTTVAVLIGSASDEAVMSKCTAMLDYFGVPFDIQILSAHRNPTALDNYIQQAESKGIQVFIAAAGMAAHLAGAVASRTQVPVIGVPLSAGDLKGMDALLSTVQMPSGIPVATVAVGSAGAKNAAILAVRILALHDDKLKNKLSDFMDNGCRIETE